MKRNCILTKGKFVRYDNRKCVLSVLAFYHFLFFFFSFFFSLFRILFEFFSPFKINIVNFFILYYHFFHFYVLRVRFHANRLSRVKEVARSYRFYKICYTLLVLYRCREYEIRIFVDIRVQFLCFKSSGTFDGFLFILYRKLTKKTFSFYI